jgi:hypothetical protein
MKKLLIGTREDLQPSVGKALEAYFELVYCRTLPEAKHALRRGADAILCELHFGEGELFDFLEHAKGQPESTLIPFICLHGSPQGLSRPLRQSVEIATRALGAELFIEISQWRAELGDEKAFEKLRGAIDELL